MASRLPQELFSGVTYPVVGIVLALLIFDGLKEGVLLPVFNGIYHSDQIHDHTTQVKYEETGALVVVRGPFVFRIGYMVSRLLLAVLVLAVALPCMWWWHRQGGRLQRATPSAESGVDADLDVVDNVAEATTVQAETAAPVAHAHLLS